MNKVKINSRITLMIKLCEKYNYLEFASMARNLARLRIWQNANHNSKVKNYFMTWDE